MALQAHIRSLLLEYALEHLTIDYIAYTEAVVSEVCALYIVSRPQKSKKKGIPSKLYSSQSI